MAVAVNQLDAASQSELRRETNTAFLIPPKIMCSFSLRPVFLFTHSFTLLSRHLSDQQHVLQSSRIMPVTFQPVFSDGWAPTITEPELMGFSSTDPDDESASIPISVVRDDRPASGRRVGGHYDDSDADDLIHGNERQSISPISKGHHNHHNHNNGSNGHPVRTGQSSSPSPIESESLERDSPAGMTSDIEQVEWLAELQSRNAKVVKVLFPRTANNDKELTVVRSVHFA